MKRSLGAKTLICPTPAWIVGSYDKQGKPNGMTVAWGGICCSQPPCLAVSLRAATYTHGNLMERRAFTVSVPSQAQVKAADYFGLVSGRDTDKFVTCNLTAVKAANVLAPVVDQCPIVYECQVVHSNDVLPERLAPGPAGMYADGQFHRVYYGKIVAALAEPNAASLLGS